MSETLIQTRSLLKTYGDKVAVNDVSFDVYGGEVFGFLGPNGAGKTTTIKMIVGLLKPTSGSVKSSRVRYPDAADAGESLQRVCPRHPQLIRQADRT
ncbi:MAG: ATP-binding cassette domain-containing protein [Anaerolineales bacterium]